MANPPRSGRYAVQSFTSPVPEALRTLAAWYRDFAERAGDPAIWDARLRTAEDFEAEAHRVESQPAPPRWLGLGSIEPSAPSSAAAGPHLDQGTPSAEELRVEAHRLLATAVGLADRRLKRELAARALALSQRAEAIVNSIDGPGIISANIKRYRSLLAAGITNCGQRHLVEEMLADAQFLLANHRRRAP